MAEADNNYYLEDITKLWQSDKKVGTDAAKSSIPIIPLKPKLGFRLPNISLPNPLDLFKPRPKSPLKLETLPDIKAKPTSKPSPQGQNRKPQRPRYNPNQTSTTKPARTQADTNKPTRERSKTQTSEPKQQPQNPKTTDNNDTQARRNNQDQPRTSPQNRPASQVPPPKPQNQDRKPKPQFKPNSNYNQPSLDPNKSGDSLQIHLD
jgi:hypothetical protein